MLDHLARPALGAYVPDGHRQAERIRERAQLSAADQGARVREQRLAIPPTASDFAVTFRSVMDEARIQEIVDRVIARIGDAAGDAGRGGEQPAAGLRRSRPRRAREAPARRREVDIPRGRRGVFADVDAAVKAARRAHEQNEAAPLEARKRWVEVMRETARKLVPALAKYAVEETGYGRVEDKLKKNMLCVDKTPGTELLQPIAWSGDDGLTLTERASYGVIGSITPTTNPTETIINNGIGMVAGGNAVVFNAHPYAARDVGVPDPPVQRRDRRARAGPRTCSPASSGRRSRAPRR